eukprot:gene9501-19740_t
MEFTKRPKTLMQDFWDQTNRHHSHITSTKIPTKSLKKLSEIAGIFSRFYESQIEILGKQLEMMKELERATAGAGNIVVAAKASSVPEKKKKKLVDPNRPKQPRTSYLQFCVENLAAVKENRPDLNHRELMTEIGRLWKTIDAERKADYDQRAAAERAAFNVLMEEYNKQSGKTVITKSKTKSTSKGVEPSEAMALLESNEEEEGTEDDEDDVEDEEEEDDDEDEDEDEVSTTLPVSVVATKQLTAPKQPNVGTKAANVTSASTTKEVNKKPAVTAVMSSPASKTPSNVMKGTPIKPPGTIASSTPAAVPVIIKKPIVAATSVPATVSTVKSETVTDGGEKKKKKRKRANKPEDNGHEHAAGASKTASDNSETPKNTALNNLYNFNIYRTLGSDIGSNGATSSPNKNLLVAQTLH